MANLVEISGLVKRYGELEAVKGLDLAIREREIFGLLGPNGAGKTTVISMLACLAVPTRGTATIAGLDVVKQAGAVKKRIGLVPQDLALYPTLSARDNLVFFGRIYGLGGKELEKRVDWALDLVGLVDRARDAIQTYSGGMKRRINIAVGLLHKPDILFLDEPTVGVDPQSRNHIFENVQRLNETGMTILYTTHYMEEAERLCHRVAIMDEGQLVALNTPQALLESLGGGMVHIGLASRVDELCREAQALPAIRSARRIDGKLEVETDRAQTALISLLDGANRLGARVTSLEIFEPNLETVFLRLTGKRLRD